MVVSLVNSPPGISAIPYKGDANWVVWGIFVYDRARAALQLKDKLATAWGGTT